MNLPTVALRNTFRNRTRALLTMGGVAVLTLAFVFLRTVIGAFTSGAETARADRLVVRSRVSLTVPLRVAMLDKIRAVPGVGPVTWTNWFGGTYLDARHFFPRFAIDPETYFQVYTDQKVSPEDLAAFEADRTGALVGKSLAERYGFKKGDVIHLKGDIYPGDWAFHVDGFFEAQNAFTATALLFPWKYLDESQPGGRKGYVGTFAFRVADPDRSPQIAHAVDALFESSANETLTESEQSFMLGFLTGSSAIIDALQAVSAVLLVIMLLILGNTLAMAVRERQGELAVLRTLGFRPGQLLSLSLAEGLWLALFGAVAGALIARPVIGGFTRAVNGFIRVGASDHWTLPAVGLSLAAGLLAALLPALQASRVDIVAALRRPE